MRARADARSCEPHHRHCDRLGTQPNHHRWPGKECPDVSTARLPPDTEFPTLSFAFAAFCLIAPGRAQLGPAYTGDCAYTGHSCRGTRERPLTGVGFPSISKWLSHSLPLSLSLSCAPLCVCVRADNRHEHQQRSHRHHDHGWQNRAVLFGDHVS